MDSMFDLIASRLATPTITCAFIVQTLRAGAKFRCGHHKTDTRLFIITRHGLLLLHSRRIHECCARRGRARPHNRISVYRSIQYVYRTIWSVLYENGFTRKSTKLAHCKMRDKYYVCYGWVVAGAYFVNCFVRWRPCVVVPSGSPRENCGARMASKGNGASITAMCI